MAKIKTVALQLPAQWASALVNGDYSGLSDAEKREVLDFLAENPHLGPCFSCGEYAEIGFYEGLLCDLLDFDFPVRFWREADGLKYLIYPAFFIEKPLPHHKLGLSYTRTGYGAKIPTEKMALIMGRFYRVYSAIFSNVGTSYAIIQGERVIVDF